MFQASGPLGFSASQGLYLDLIFHVFLDMSLRFCAFYKLFCLFF